jgi:hypothetical protein
MDPSFLRGFCHTVSVKDHTVLSLMASFELCTDCMSSFIGPGKPSSFCNYFVVPHLPASCGAGTFRRGNEVEGQDFIPGAGARF